MVGLFYFQDRLFIVKGIYCASFHCVLVVISTAEEELERGWEQRRLGDKDNQCESAFGLPLSGAKHD
jgi:hypothetical protein